MVDHKEDIKILSLKPGSIVFISALQPTFLVKTNSVTKDITQQPPTYYQEDNIVILLEATYINLQTQYWTSWYKVLLLYKNNHLLCWIDGRSIVNGKKLYIA